MGQIQLGQNASTPQSLQEQYDLNGVGYIPTQDCVLSSSDSGPMTQGYKDVCELLMVRKIRVVVAAPWCRDVLRQYYFSPTGGVRNQECLEMLLVEPLGLQVGLQVR